MAEIDSTIWFSCSLLKPKFNLCFTDIIYAYTEPKSWLVMSKFEPCLDFHNALLPFIEIFTKELSKRS